MKIKNGYDEITFTRDILNMASVDKHIIKLPYMGEVNNDMLYEAFYAALNDCFNERDNINSDSRTLFEDVVRSVSTYIIPHVQPWHCGATMELHITATNGKTTVRKLVLDIEIIEALAIMQAFFHEGSGLNPQNRELVESQYEAYIDWKLN